MYKFQAGIHARRLVERREVIQGNVSMHDNVGTMMKIFSMRIIFADTAAVDLRFAVHLTRTKR